MAHRTRGGLFRRSSVALAARPHRAARDRTQANAAEICRRQAADARAIQAGSSEAALVPARDEILAVHAEAEDEARGAGTDPGTPGYVLGLLLRDRRRHILAAHHK